jgi:hypothetical protein
MKKTRRFQDGGVADEDFTADQLKFLGGADRTDPYILARMRSKFPDAPKAKKTDTKVDAGEIKDEFGEKSSIRKNTETGELYDTAPSIAKEVKKSTVKTAPKSTQAKKTVTDMNEMPEKLRAPGYKPSSMVKTIDKKNVSKPTPRSTNRLTTEDYNLGLDAGLENKGKRLMTDSGMTMKSGGKVSSASKRADGCAVRGKTRA